MLWEWCFLKDEIKVDSSNLSIKLSNYQFIIIQFEETKVSYYIKFLYEFVFHPIGACASLKSSCERRPCHISYSDLSKIIYIRMSINRFIFMEYLVLGKQYLRSKKPFSEELISMSMSLLSFLYLSTCFSFPASKVYHL